MNSRFWEEVLVSAAVQSLSSDESNGRLEEQKRQEFLGAQDSAQ